MAKVIVLHNVDAEGDLHDASEFGSICGRFWGFCTEHSALRVAYSYETDSGFGLENVFRDNNRVDGTERPEMEGHRSLSVGDVVVVWVDGALKAWAVASFGWDEVTYLDVLEASGRPARERTRG